MTEKNFKSSILTKMSAISLQSSILSQIKPILSSSLLSSSKASLETSNTQIIEKNKKKLELETKESEISKKAKTLDLSYRLNLNSNFSHLTSKNLLTTTTNNLLHASKKLDTAISLNNSLLDQPKQIQLPEINIVEKRPFSSLESSDENDENSFVLYEYLKVDSIINTLKNEENLVKRFKPASNQSLAILEKPLVIFDLKHQKNVLINAVSSSLLNQPNFKNPNDSTRANLFSYVDLIINHDPEFILKLALYTRRELNIRVTANFLIAVASYKEVCRPYLQRYFNNTVMLPSDWIEIAEQYQIFMDKNINFGSLPSALRKCMVEKFSDFDQYQLAKYNKEKSRLAKNSTIKDVKHIKSKLKDDDGKETDLIEEKFIKSINQGLKINDRIQIELVVNSKCENLKFDIIHREEIEKQNKVDSTSFKPTVTRRGRPLPVPAKKPENEVDIETVAVRISLDYLKKRILQKSCFKKTWSKRSDVINSPEGYSFSLGYESVHFFIDIKSNDFKFGVRDETNQKDIVLSSYLHSKHNIELFKLNVVRISGVEIKLKDLKIFSNDKIGWDREISDETEVQIKQRSFTLKQLIRQLHIARPVNNVMCLLGKKYPASFEDFIQSKLEGEYDQTKNGKRMKLPVPETWETQISMHGNKAEVWQKLIDNKKLPYMAMLRNLRNMIKSGISNKHHDWVIKKLQDEGAVINSKQFPFRFFTAYEILDELLVELNNYNKWLENPDVEMVETRVKRNTTIKNTKKTPSDVNYNEELIKRYKTALDNALKVATRFNVSPIKGSTAIFVNCGNEMQVTVGGSGKSLGKKVNTLSDIAALMGLMLKYACEYSKLIVYSQKSIHKDISLEQGTILDNMKSLTDLHNLSSAYGSSYPKECFIEILQNREYFDNIVVLGSINDVIFHQNFLKKYRTMINKDLLFVNVDLANSSQCSLVNNLSFNHYNDICIAGYSDSILRFIAERGNQGQLIHIENIDKSYDLPDLKNIKTNIEVKEKEKIENTKSISKKIPIQIVSQWKTIKVFISSTFKDFHTERDILSRTVFPLLRSKLSEYMINIYEIDMRWGITEQEANNNETLKLCLNQIMDCDYFIGLIGNRYGMRLNEYNASHDWLNSYPAGASITELEIEAQIRKCTNSHNEFEKSFFYFRDNNSFISSVPEIYRNHFEDEEDDLLKIDKLKQRIKSKPFEIFNGYTGKWLGYDTKENRALLTGLDHFAERVFNNLYNSIRSNHAQSNTDLNIENKLTQINNAYIEAFASLFTGRHKLVNKLEKILKETTLVTQVGVSSTEAAKELIKKQNSIVNICLCQADVGAGKTTFICNFYLKHLPRISSFNFGYSVGAFSGSEFVITFLKCFCIRVLNFYKFYNCSDFDENSNDFNYYKKIFDSILNEFNNSSLSKTDRFYILIDGIDMFIDSNGNKDESFNWLPEIIPPSISFIFTARTNSQIRSILEKISYSNQEKNIIKLSLFEIENLDVLDKSELVKSNLQKFNKKLDESSFNNQMKILTGKREANNPLYLSLACEEIRVHNQFESLTNKLKELPAKANLLIQYVFERLEKEYGSKLINALFMFIGCSKEGLTEQELYELLELYINLDSYNNALEQLENAESILYLSDINQLFTHKKKRLAQQTFLSLLQTISGTFLKPRSDSKSSLINFKSHSLIENAIRLKYNDKRLEITNKIMALYFWHQIDTKFEFEWNMNNQRAYINLPFHLSFSNSYFDLANVLCDLKFIAQKSQFGQADMLMNDFDLNQESISKNIFKNISSSSVVKKIKIPIKNSNLNIINSKRFNDYKLFITTNYHILASNPSLIFQQAINEPAECDPAKDVLLLLRSESNLSGSLFEWVNKPSNEKIKAITLNNFNDSSVSTISILKNGDLIACGTENCEIKLFSLSTATLIKSLQGHSGRINQLVFANNDTLISVASDGIASVWSVKSGFRIKVLKNHNGHVVSSVCALSKVFITAGWDCAAKIFDTDNLELKGELKGHTQPINCIVFNPDGFQVATGSWDGAIRIFNITDRARKAVLRSHKSSIRSISYSCNSVYLASSSIDGEIKLWNAKIGSCIASLKGHSMPVNSICFSPNQRFLITGSSDRRVKVWSGSVGKIVRIIKENDKNPITSVCFENKTGKYLAAGYHSGEIKIYETNTGSLKLRIEKVHDTPIKRVKYSSCNRFLLSSANDGTVRITELIQFENKKLAKSKLVGEFKGNAKSVNSFSINQYDIVITGSEDCILNIYEPSECMKSNIDDFDKIQSLFDVDMEIEQDYSENKPRILNKQAGIFSYPIHSINVHKSPITSIVFNSIGEKFASASKDANIIIWSLNRFNLELNQIHNINNAHLDWINDLSWSNSSEFIVSASNDFSLKIWNAETGKECHKLTGHTSNINSCSFQYGCVVSTSSDGLIKVWSHKGFEIATLEGHQQRVNACDLHFKIIKKKELSEKIQESWAERVDEAEYEESHKKAQLDKDDIKVEQVLLVTVSDDSSIRLWKPNESDWLVGFENHNDKVNALDLSSNDILATASSDTTVNIYNMKNFFNEFSSGIFINSEIKIKNHYCEITSIVFSNFGQYMFSSSCDGILIVWKCNFGLNNNDLTSFDPIQELKAHEKSINKMCILSDSKKQVTFATCSDDKTIKIWKLNENLELELIRTLCEIGSVFYVFTYKTETENFLISVVIDSFKLDIKTYSIDKKYVQTGYGIQIVAFQGLVQQVKKTDNYLYITLIQNEIYKLNLKDMFAKLGKTTFNCSYKNENLDKITLSGDSNSNWFTSLDELNESTYAGDCKGNLCINNRNNENKLIFKKTIHSGPIIEVISFKTADRLITVSQDCTIKVWSDYGEYQIGQFNTKAAVTSIELLKSSSKYNFVIGDKLGNLNLIIWHDNE
jgi:telomerase protein component 1